MEEILSYLAAPNKTGVYTQSFFISWLNLSDLKREIFAFERRMPIFAPFDLEENDDPDQDGKEKAKTAIEEFGKMINYSFLYMPGNTLPKIEDIENVVVSSKEINSKHNRFSALPFNPSIFLSPNVIFPKTKDAANIKISFEKPNLVFDIISIKESGCKTFGNFFETIPVIGEQIKKTSLKKRHSSRFCSEPYPAAVLLWTYGNTIVPRDILNYFKSSVTYFEKEEWRISIILAAIAVESLLAEIYEEYYHDVAPSDPLGALKDSIEKKEKFPVVIKREVEIVNQSRIAAVHRGPTTVGEREARNALSGATRFCHWTFTEGPLKR